MNETMAGPRNDDHIIAEGKNYIVIKGSFMKLAKLKTQKQCQLGRTAVDVAGLLGHPVGTQFKLRPGTGRQRLLQAEPVQRMEDLADVISTDESAADNRNLVADPSSQSLTRENIMAMRDQGVTGKEIVNTIVDNSTSFQGKTEYSQAKYVRKKQKKYFEFISVHEPTARLVASMYYMQDPLKIMNLRVDSLSQLLTACSVRAGGRYLLLESGCLGVVVAAVLERLGGRGRLVHLFQGGVPQRQAVDAINFSEAELACLTCLDLPTLTSRLPPGSVPADLSGRGAAGGVEVTLADGAAPPTADEATPSNGGGATCPAGAEVAPANGAEVTPVGGREAAPSCDGVAVSSVIASAASSTGAGAAPAEDQVMSSVGAEGAEKDRVLPSVGAEGVEKDQVLSSVGAAGAEKDQVLPSVGAEEAKDAGGAPGAAEPVADGNSGTEAPRKRRLSDEQAGSAPKKSKYARTRAEDSALALELLSAADMDGLLLCCRQHPLNLLRYLIDFVAPSRPFAVFCPYKEPLLECYFAMKAKGCIMLRVTETWLRNYQVLPERTHPEINMSGGGGYLLTGLKVERTLGAAEAE